MKGPDHVESFLCLMLPTATPPLRPSTPTCNTKTTHVEHPPAHTHRRQDTMRSDNSACHTTVLCNHRLGLQDPRPHRVRFCSNSIELTSR
eukprot:2702709-Rhodomonas_salina.3